MSSSSIAAASPSSSRARSICAFPSPLTPSFSFAIARVARVELSARRSSSRRSADVEALRVRHVLLEEHLPAALLRAEPRVIRVRAEERDPEPDGELDLGR